MGVTRMGSIPSTGSGLSYELYFVLGRKKEDKFTREREQRRTHRGAVGKSAKYASRPAGVQIPSTPVHVGVETGFNSLHRQWIVIRALVCVRKKKRRQIYQRKRVKHNTRWCSG